MPAALPRRPFILAIDDDPAMHETFDLIFSETEYEFLGVCDGDRALEILRARPVDVVLLDLRMPGIGELGGLELLPQIKAIRPATSVIVVSALDRALPVLDSRRLGAMDYVTKPFDEDHFQLLVRQAIAQASDTDGVRGAVTPPWILIVGESLGIRATLAAALGNRCRVTVVATVVEAASVFTRTRPDLIVADVVAQKGISEVVFTGLQAHFAGVPLIWVASSSQWAPLVQDQSFGSRRAVFRTPVDYLQLLSEAGTLLGRERAPFRQPGRISGLVMNHVAEHFADTSVEDIAQAVRLSPGHLSRVFRDETGMRPKDFVTRVQLEAARCFLRETQEKVDDIAVRVGLCDGPHLSRLLWHYYRRTPRQYRSPGRPD